MSKIEGIGLIITATLLQSYVSYVYYSNYWLTALAFIPLLGLLYFGILMFRSNLLYESIQQKLTKNREDHTPLHKGKPMNLLFSPPLFA